MTSQTTSSCSQGRLSAPISNHSKLHDEHTHAYDYQLVQRLRAIRRQGDADLEGAEHYDPDFSVKLAAAATPADADMLLAAWFERRAGTLKMTQERLRAEWQKSVDEMRPRQESPSAAGR